MEIFKSTNHILYLDEKIEFEQDQVGEIRDGMTLSALMELKLTMRYKTCPQPSQVAALLDGLFWSCRPEILCFFGNQFRV
ncbi:hypothetical protein KSS87_023490 [Heliosperma pusillum]|nr:hypothetical protein KSS87_023490 [Heliosperma pusillum]